MQGKSTRRLPDIPSLAKMSCNLFTSGTRPAPRVVSAADATDDGRVRFCCIVRARGAMARARVSVVEWRWVAVQSPQLPFFFRRRGIFVAVLIT